MNALCSIVIPVHNRAALVRRTIESCLEQTYSEIEVILVDDGSTDGSSDICKEYSLRYSSDQRRVYYIRQDNAGACVARNKGLEIANGEFLLFLDSDDIIPSNKLTEQISAILSSNSHCCISDYMTIDEAGCPIKRYSNNLSPKQFVASMRSPSNSAILIRRKSVPEFLRWNIKLHRLQDLDFMLRYLSTVESWVYIPKVLYHYRLHTGERISDSYERGTPYATLFFSMKSHLTQSHGSKYTNFIVLARFTFALFRHGVRVGVLRSTPTPIKEFAKKILSGRKGQV